MLAGWKRWIVPLVGIAAVLVVVQQGCGTTGGPGGKKLARNAAERVYVAPGEHDEYYAFLSGGHSGQIFVYGLPSCRYLKTIPVFTPEPAFGWGVDEHSKAMLKGFAWGDAHHPSLSETDGDYDGRWLFINDMPNARIARIDLTTFMTAEIFGPIPNISAAHACPFVTENTEYVFAASRFSATVPPQKDAAIQDYATAFDGIIAGIKIDPTSGAMSLGFEILMPPFDWDLADAGKGSRSRHPRTTRTSSPPSTGRRPTRRSPTARASRWAGRSCSTHAKCPASSISSRRPRARTASTSIPRASTSSPRASSPRSSP
jgi:nitrous-oxide reductase